MFLNERAQKLIKELRDNNYGGVDAAKASICDAMSIIMIMHEMHASGKEKDMLIDAIGTLINYNEQLTELSIDK